MSKHPPTDFLKYIGTPFEKHILPIIPAGADISADSSLTAEHLGKIPGLWAWRQKVWYGFRGWQRHFTKKQHIEKWQSWQDADKADTAIALGLRLGEVVAIDIDINHAELADEAEARVRDVWGDPICVRRREDSARRVLLYIRKPRTMPITKARVTFSCPLTSDEVNAVEILGWGQQVVIEGPHAKGAMHYWLDGVGLADICEKVDGEWKLKGKPGLVTTDDALRLTTGLAKWVNGKGDEGWKILVPGKAGKLRDPSKEHQIDSPNNPHYLPLEERDLLTRAINAIDLNDDRLALYDDWFKLMLAICASVGRDMDYFHEVVLPWLQTYPANEPEAMELKWRNAFSTSTLGAGYVYHVAALFGFTEGVQKQNDDLVAALYPTDGDHEDGATSPDAGERHNAESVGDVLGMVGAGASGPLPPGHSDVSLRDSFIEKQGQHFRYVAEVRDPRVAWIKQHNGLWVPAYPEFAQAVSDHCCDVGRDYRAAPSGGKIDKELRSFHRQRAIEGMLAKSPEMVVSQDQFDVDPWLLNTPEGVVDIRTLELRAHEPTDLMRMQTAVSPLIAATGLYHFFCPQWLRYIDFMANGDERVTSLLRRYGAYMLTSYTNDLYFLFMWGVPNSGKSVFISVLEKLLATYVTPVSQYFFMRQFDKRTFELYQLKGKRGALAGEVPKGATWDVQLLSTMLGGSKLKAEGKGRDFIEFYNTAKVIIAGNHAPSFPSNTEKDGIDRRMLRLDFSRRVDEVLPDDRDFAARVVATEGHSILMWFLEEAQQGYQDLQNNGSFMGATADLGLALARAYRLKANPHVQWIEDEMERDPDAQIPAKSAWHAYQEWGDKQGMWRGQKMESYDDFQVAMRNLDFSVKKPTSHKQGMAMVMHGLRPKNKLADDEFLRPEATNVASLYQQAPLGG
jgi:putative DNA primase/helicase